MARKTRTHDPGPARIKRVGRADAGRLHLLRDAHCVLAQVDQHARVPVVRGERGRIGCASRASDENGARVLNTFNADRLTDSGLKPEIGPACHDADWRAQFAHSVGQGSTAQPGGRRQLQRSGIRDQTGVLETLPRASNTAAACFKGMGSFRLASQTGEPYTTRPAAPFANALHSRVGSCPHARGFMSSPDRPFATMPDAELVDEIAYQREIISHAAPKYIRPAQNKLAELLGEAGHREWLRDGVPW